MAIVKTINGHTPRMGTGTWLAENAVVTGDVVIGDNCSVWYHAVIRGDVNHIEIGDNTNVQDGAVVHGSTGGPPTVVGSDVSIGHRAIVHGCIIEDAVLIGMGAIVLDLAVVKTGAIVAAGAVVTGGKVLEGGYIYAGTPARPIKPITEAMRQSYIAEIAAGYTQLKNLQ
jgi:carbonic anhydrase/acetyltransferase-like protein (isoleucine patch superfamily)